MERLGFTNRTGIIIRLGIVAFWALAIIFTFTSGVPTSQRWVLLGLLMVYMLLIVAGLLPEITLLQIYLILGLHALIIIVGAGILSDFNVLIPATCFLTVIKLSPPWDMRIVGLFLLLTMGIDIFFTGFVPGFRDGVVKVIILYAFSLFATSMLRSDESRKETQRLLKELEAAHQQLQEHANQVEELAISEERNRLSRELHDTLGHRLTVSIVQLEGVRRLISSHPDRAASKISAVSKQLDEGLSELRRTVAVLHSPKVIDLSMPRALKQLATDFERATKLQISVAVPDSLPPLPDAYRLAIYRIAQEGLTNVQRHAQATEASLTLDISADTLTFKVTDNGVGQPKEAEHQGFGLRSMRERAEQVGGNLKIHPNKDAGTILVLSLQIPNEEAYVSN